MHINIENNTLHSKDKTNILILTKHCSKGEGKCMHKKIYLALYKHLKSEPINIMRYDLDLLTPTLQAKHHADHAQKNHRFLHVVVFPKDQG